MKNLKLILAMTTIVVFFASCTKKGEPGAQGPAGQNGTDGNANVHSFNYRITAWGYDGNYYYSDLTASEGLSISASDIANGALMSYIETTAGWTLLTYAYPLGSNGTQFYRAYFDVNNFLIRVNNSNSSSDAPYLTATPSSPRGIKIVVIPQLRMAQTDIDWSNYQDVKREFNLAD